jgi:hypothetical protein
VRRGGASRGAASPFAAGPGASKSAASLAVALAATALLLAGCGGGGNKPAGAHASASPAGRAGQRSPDATALDALMRRRAAAFQAGSPEAYAATATGPQRRRDRRVARNARGVGLRDVELAVDSADVGEGRARLRVRSIYGIRGIAGRFGASRQVTAVRTDAGWRVRSESSHRERNPWEVGPVAERRTPHFVVVAPRGLDIDSAGLPAALEQGYARMGNVLRRPKLRPRYLVVVAQAAGAARSLTSHIRGVEGLAAISDSEVREAGPARKVTAVPSQRLLVVWPPFSALGAEGRRRVVTHELTHAALAGVTSGRTPSWLLEGVALYVSEDRRVGEAAQLVTGAVTGSARRALTLTGLSSPDAIARLQGPAQPAAYAYASAAAFYIVDRYGRKRYLQLYDAFNDEAIQGAPGPGVTDRAVRRTLHVSLTRLERDLRRWIVTRAVVAPGAP